MMELYYSVDNGGDGSAYPVFCENEELANWHQDHIQEGWGEPCVGSVTINGTCTDCTTKESYLLDLLFEDWEGDNVEELKEFKKAFFPDGVPEFEMRKLSEKEYGVFQGDVMIYREYLHDDIEQKTISLKSLSNKE